MKPETRKGLREAVGAIGTAVLIALLIAAIATLLTGCAGGQAFTKYEHHSSIPDYFDANTADILGGCVEVKLCATCGEYSPTMGGCVNYEVTRKPVFGRDPSGELWIRQPVRVW